MYFISHASADKPLALDLKIALGGDAWVDLHELDVGDVLVDEIAKGIEQASDYVLLWSHASAVSNWVSFEFNMALVRWIEERAIRIRIVVLDDSDLPLTFSPFVQLRRPGSAGEIAEALAKAPTRVPMRRTFVNRHDEIGDLEASLNSPGPEGIVWLYGVAGIGKRSIATEGIRRLIPDRSRVRVLSAQPGFGEVELGLAAAAALSTEYGPEGLERDDAVRRLVELIGDYAAAGGIWVIEDAQHLLTESAGQPNDILSAILGVLEVTVCTDIDKLAVFTSSRRARFSRPTIRQVNVGGLRRDDAVALLRSRGVHETVDAMQRAAMELDGHPFGLELLSGYPSIESVNWSEHRTRVAADVLGGIVLQPGTDSLMEALALMGGPLPASDFAHHLGLSAKGLQAAVGEASQYALIRDDRNAYLSLHPLVRDAYFLRARRDPDLPQRISDLADRSRTFLKKISVGTTIYVDSLVATFRLLGLSGRLDEALELRRDLFGSLEQAAIELYRSQDYRLATEYFEKVLDYGGRTLRPLLYLARCLAHLGRGLDAHALVDEAEDLSPADPWVVRVRGRVDFTLGDIDSAIANYERALTMRPTSRQTHTDLAQAYVQKEDWARASEHIQPLLDDDPSAFALSLHSQILEATEEWSEAYDVMSAAVRLDPGNTLYHHRLGRIAQQLGDVDAAMSEYATAIELDSGRSESKLSLASLLVDEKMIDEARTILSSIPEPGTKVRSVMYNIEARTHLASGNIGKARRAVQEALARWRSRQNLGLACEVEIAAIHDGEIDPTLGFMRVETYAEELVGFSPEYAEQLVSRAVEASGRLSR